MNKHPRSEAQIRALKQHAENCKNKPSPNRLDLTGQKYGKLTPVEYVGRDKLGFTLWKCLCECGESRITSTNQLRMDVVRCCRKCTKIARHKHNLTGQRFGKLVAQTLVSDLKQKGNKWFCLCDCGRKKLVGAWNLLHGLITSCGCMAAERGRKTKKI